MDYFRRIYATLRVFLGHTFYHSFEQSFVDGIKSHGDVNFRFSACEMKMVEQRNVCLIKKVRVTFRGRPVNSARECALIQRSIRAISLETFLMAPSQSNS